MLCFEEMAPLGTKEVAPRVRRPRKVVLKELHHTKIQREKEREGGDNVSS